MTSTQRMTLIAAILGSSIAAIDGTIINVALPAIQADLGGGLQAQQWIANAYTLTLGSLILIGGSLGDIYGKRRVFAIGIASFGVLSLLCAVAPTSETLIAARALQGAAGALLAPSSLAIIVAAFDAGERGKAIGSWTAWGGIAIIVGPLVGGVIVDQTSWRWIFAINVPLVLLTLALVRSAVPDLPTTRRRVDFLGAGLVGLGLAAIVFGLIEQPNYGWGSPIILGALSGGVILLGAFVAYEQRASHPMLRLDLFARRNFALANLETLSMYAGLSILFFFLFIFLQEVAGYSALKAGLTTIPSTLIMFALSSRMGALADRHGPRLFLTGGPLLAAAGILLFLRTGIETSYVGDLLPALIVFSLGLTMTVAPLTATVLADADVDDAGIASAINNAIARCAGLIGVSAIGAVVSGRLPGNTFAPNSGSVAAFHTAIVICAVLVGLGGVIAFLGIRDPARVVKAEECPGGQLAGTPRAAVAESQPA
ncbi:MAG: MFS transporter [Thermoleophilia bacterium]|nr:MFS transporter [Thermoleophilia bacterium]